ncbi:MAG: putative metal-binding motif-containing protein [Sandaracinaceae bacterium]|nr:putative metal-binding motif-containing protein [Sandaracinaceae bacterium]
MSSFRGFLALTLAAGVLGGCGGGEPPDAAVPDAPGLDAPECLIDGDCEDGLACNGQARCASGRCVAGEALDCDDHLACTADGCSEELRACVHRVPDEDADGHGASSCVDARGVPLGDDCDDAEISVHPGAAELCDAEGADEDCDPSTLGGRDGDGDGFVDSACCNGSACGDDCNDAVRGASPAGTEVCDGLDDDCDGSIDEDVLALVFRDLDGDGHGDPAASRMACPGAGGYVALGDDCDDASAMRSPTLFEACDGIDNDCDGVADPADAPVIVRWYLDEDGDGFGDPSRATESCAVPGPGFSLLGTDCDDADAARHPGQREQCNGLDDDCNGRPDFEIGPGDTEDDDLDGRPDARCTPAPAPDRADCDDRDAATGGGASEICDGRDNDCDRATDEGVFSTLFYRDADADGWGNATGGTLVGCGAAVGYTERAGDCDDANVDRHPSQIEACNGTDEDCDARIDEEVPASVCGALTCIAGSCRATSVLRCTAPQADCDHLTTNGCETDLSSDVMGCGVCGRVCPAGGAATVPLCIDGSCGVACLEGYESCNTTLDDGCETMLGTDLDCASCGDTCGADAHCNPVSRRCERADGCVAPLADCDHDGSCETDTSRDVSHCGSCVRECTGFAAGWSCSAGACVVESCSGGMLDCNSLPDDGCETDGRTVLDCGTCGHPCMGPGASWTCATGTCAIASCLGGAQDCNGDPLDGCEIPANDPSHCGTCTRDCLQEPHTMATCNLGVCSAPLCAGGFVDCNHDLGAGGDGCERMGTCPAVTGAFTWGGSSDDSVPLGLLDVAVDGAGNVYVVTTFAGALHVDGVDVTAPGLGVDVLSFDASLSTVRWATTIEASVMGDVSAYRLAISGSTVVVVGTCFGEGDLLVGGTVGPALATQSPFVTALDTADGHALWSRVLPSAMAAEGRALDIDVFNGHVVAGGYTQSDLELTPGMSITASDDGWVARLALADGSPVSIVAISGPASIAVDALDVREFDHDVFLGGQYSAGAWMLGGTMMPAGGGLDGWAARCSSGIGCGSACPVATASNERVTDVHASDTSKWVFAGEFFSSTTVNGTTLTSGGDGGFLAGVGYVGGAIGWVVGHTGTGETWGGVQRFQVDGMGRIHTIFSARGSLSFGGRPVGPDAFYTPNVVWMTADTGGLISLTSLGPVSVDVLSFSSALRADGASALAGTLGGTTSLGGLLLTSAGGVDQLVALTP